MSASLSRYSSFSSVSLTSRLVHDINQAGQPPAAASDDRNHRDYRLRTLRLSAVERMTTETHLGPMPASAAVLQARQRVVAPSVASREQRHHATAKLRSLLQVVVRPVNIVFLRRHSLKLNRGAAMRPVVNALTTRLVLTSHASTTRRSHRRQRRQWLELAHRALHRHRL